jgi:hypothetical protein
MIPQLPDNLYGPLFILGGALLLLMSFLGHRRGRQEGLYTRYGKLAFAVLMIGFGVLLIKAAGGR